MIDMEIYPPDDRPRHPVRDDHACGTWERRAGIGNGEAALLLVGAAIPPLAPAGEARRD